MDPALALQSLIRARLVGASAVTALVPASSILDVNQRADVMPAILLGEGQVLPDSGLARDRFHVFLTLHLWAQEVGTVFIKQVAGAIRDALADTFWPTDDIAVADLFISESRYMRDPDGVHSHGVVTLECRVQVLEAV